MKFLEASISMNNKQMDENDVSASVACPADYIPYFSFMQMVILRIPLYIDHQ